MRKNRERKIVDFLSILESASASGYVSGQLLAKSAGISRSAVWKHVRQLRRYGYGIDSTHGLGYRMVSRTSAPVPWELKKRLKTRIIGKEIIHRDSRDSTQSIALAIATKCPEADGTVVILEHQKSGRGRLKRKWLSPAGGLWLSVLSRPRVETPSMTVLPLVAALAVRNAIVDTTHLRASLKWPNDVMISGKKVAGILLDVSAEAEILNYAVFGIGINANVDAKEIATKAAVAQEITSLKEELGHEVNRLELAAAVLQNLECQIDKFVSVGPGPIISEWKKNTDMLGTRISVLHDGNEIQHGIAADLDTDGALIVISDSGEKSRVTSGDLRIRF